MYSVFWKIDQNECNSIPQSIVVVPLLMTTILFFKGGVVFGHMIITNTWWKAGACRVLVKFIHKSHSSPQNRCIHTSWITDKGSKISPLTMEVFLGKWKSEASEGFEDYLQALGEFIHAWIRLEYLEYIIHVTIFIQSYCNDVDKRLGAILTFSAKQKIASRNHDN